MDLKATIALAALCLALAVLFGWRGAKTAQPITAPRLVPWRFLMLLAFTGMIAMLVHLVNLLKTSNSVGA